MRGVGGKASKYRGVSWHKHRQKVPLRLLLVLALLLLLVLLLCCCSCCCSR